MTWQQRAIGVVTLVVLTMIPAAATMCAIVCAENRLAADHCHEAAGSSSQLQSSQFQLGAAPAHDCGSHETVVGEVAPPPQLRMALPALTLSFDPDLLHSARYRQHTSLAAASTAPPGGAPPGTTPSVLRV